MKFELGDKVVYPNQGVAVIQDLVTKRIGGMRGEYYILTMESTNSTVMVPADNIDAIGLRPLSSKTKLEELFSLLRNGTSESESDAKVRFKENTDKMKEGSLEAVGGVLKSLHLLSQKKGLGVRDQRMLDGAWQLIVSEVAAVLNVSEEDARRRLEKMLEEQEVA